MLGFQQMQIHQLVSKLRCFAALGKTQRVGTKEYQKVTDPLWCLSPRNSGIVRGRWRYMFTRVDARVLQHVLPNRFHTEGHVDFGYSMCSLNETQRIMCPLVSKRGH